MSGLRQGATEHSAAHAAALTLAEALRAIRLDPAALGAVNAVPGFAGAVATAVRTQADGASTESTYRSDAERRAGSAATMAQSMIDTTTRQARAVPGLPVR